MGSFVVLLKMQRQRSPRPDRREAGRGQGTVRRRGREAGGGEEGERLQQPVRVEAADVAQACPYLYLLGNKFINTLCNQGDQADQGRRGQRVLPAEDEGGVRAPAR